MADIFLELGVDEAKFRKAVQAVVPPAKKSGKDAGKGFSDNFQSSASAGFSRLIKTAVAAGAAIGAALFTRASVRAAIEQQDAVTGLNNALIQAGRFSESASRSYQEFASDLQSVSRFTSQAVLEQVKYSQAIGASESQTKELIRASVDLSAALGTSLSFGVERLNRTLLGELPSRLAQVVPELRNLTEEQLRAGAAIDIVGGKFQGFSERDLQTFSGQVVVARNAFGSLQEQLGFLVVNNPAFTKALGALSRGFESLSQTVADNANILIRLVNDVFIGIVSASQKVIDGVSGITKAFTRLTGFARDIEIAASIRALSVEIGEAERGVARFRKLDQQAREAFIESNKLQIEALRQERDEQALVNQQRTDGIEGIRLKAFEVGESIKAALAESDESGPFDSIGESALRASSNVSFALKETTEEIRSRQSQIAGITGALTSGISRSIQALGSSLVTGENFFKSFVGIALNALGDLLISFGTGAIAVGTTAEAIRNSIIGLFGGQAIVAGVAAIAAGGALKAFAGSLGASGAGGPSIASPTGTEDGGVISSPAAPFAETQQEDRRADQFVQVVVQGDILDSEDTGRRLLDLLNENFKSNSGTIVGARYA